MRIIINGFKGSYFNVQDWFCEQEGIDKHEAEYVRETDKAVLLDFGDKQVWIPKSLFTVHGQPAGLEAFQ